MDYNQIYELANSAAQQSMGKEAITATDTASLVALGQQILSSDKMVENFTNTLVLRIARTIIVYRMYTNKMAPIMMDNIEWGAIVQKIDSDMPDFIEDEAWNLEDGKSVDMYIVRKPKLHQTFFAKRVAYSTYITIWKKNLKAAFLNESSMGSFIDMLFGKVRNALQLTMENLSRLTLDNFIALMGDSQKVHLLTEYNSIAGTTITSAEKAMYSEQFLRFMLGRINMYSMNMENLSVLYNKIGRERFTPRDRQILITHNMLQVNMETQVQYAAFHENLVSLQSSFSVPYWQSAESPFDISLNAKTGGTEDDTAESIEVKNIVGVLFDRDALGTFRQETDVVTTPLNARGLYTNTFWHEDQMWFNDVAENGIVFLLD